MLKMVIHLCMDIVPFEKIIVMYCLMIRLQIDFFEYFTCFLKWCELELYLFLFCKYRVSLKNLPNKWERQKIQYQKLTPKSFYRLFLTWFSNQTLCIIFFEYLWISSLNRFTFFLRWRHELEPHVHPGLPKVCTPWAPGVRTLWWGRPLWLLHCCWYAYLKLRVCVH